MITQYFIKVILFNFKFLVFSCFINIQCFMLIETCKSNRISRILLAYMTRINSFLFVVNLTCCNFVIRVSCFSVEFVISINSTELSSKNKIECLSSKKKNELYFDVAYILTLIANKV